MKNRKNTGGSQSIGTDGLTHYERNKQAYIAKSVARKNKNTEYIRDIKKNGYCVDCKNSDWRVLDFDHLPGYIKLGDVSGTRIIHWSQKRIDEEIAKCELVCSNCHRIRTYERRQNKRV